MTKILRIRIHIRTASRPHSIIFFTLTLVLFLVASCIPVKAQPLSGLSEYKVKAAFLYKFALFVDWPQEAFADSSSPYMLGILGTDPFGRAIDEMLQDEKINGRSIIIKRFGHYQQITNCHILFISISENSRLKHIFKHLGDAPILTVGDTERFALDGGIINFIRQDNKIRFEINHTSAVQHRLKISSKLLRLAKIIEN